MSGQGGSGQAGNGQGLQRPFPNYLYADPGDTRYRETRWNGPLDDLPPQSTPGFKFMSRLEGLMSQRVDEKLLQIIAHSWAGLSFSFNKGHICQHRPDEPLSVVAARATSVKLVPEGAAAINVRRQELQGMMRIGRPSMGDGPWISSHREMGDVRMVVYVCRWKTMENMRHPQLPPKFKEEVIAVQLAPLQPGEEGGLEGFKISYMQLSVFELMVPYIPMRV